MIQYSDDYTVACVDGLKFRKDKKTGYYLSSKKIGEKRKRLHVYIWESNNGTIPAGYDVHHKDHDKNNNDIDNLELLERDYHRNLHKIELSDDERKRRSENVKEKAMPMAAKWHRSEDGREWHREHGRQVFATMQEKEYVCGYCGKIFKSKHRYGADQNTFCGNNCKAAYRRRSGADNVKKICECCGSEYEANKYVKTKYCKDCQNRKGYPRTRVQHGGRG